jgi:hypothetical protein
LQKWLIWTKVTNTKVEMDKISSSELVLELQQLKIQISNVFMGEISFFWT